MIMISCILFYLFYYFILSFLLFYFFIITVVFHWIFFWFLSVCKKCIHWKDWCWSKASIFWPLDVKRQLIGKDPDAGDSITDSMNMRLSKLWELVEDRGSWHAEVHGVARSWTELNKKCITLSWYLDELSSAISIHFIINALEFSRLHSHHLWTEMVLLLLFCFLSF